MRRFLPERGPHLRVLDLGGGTGFVSVRLARLEFQVVLLDDSEEMLQVARRDAEENGVASRISFRCGDADHLNELIEAKSFDAVICHNVLEYVADPGAIVTSVSHLLREDAIVSILVRNRAGEVLKAAIKSHDWRRAEGNLCADAAVDSLYGEQVRIFEPAEVRNMLESAGLDVTREYGVRVFSDYVDSKVLEGEAYRQLFDLELALGAETEFAAIARYTQFIARRPHTSNATKSNGTRP